MPVGQESPTRGMGVWARALVTAKSRNVMASNLDMHVPSIILSELWMKTGKVEPCFE